ncbi:serine/threonine-protein phosphatase 7 long form-like protein [Gossypium australe]|uniref:Serine/threonine-protein phosphatase 7 long form-like protein n=1 Tax=Gossypium australe TaxID=47621 RepID=A0A5B6UGR2_9ROSI|nr:serine/threonine-protein phosphatase 7 long form-like protein [Gossypium australe]
MGKDYDSFNGEYRVLRGHVHGSSYRPNERIFLYLDIEGFGMTTLIRTFALRADLISALVERWRLETHTCRLSCEECTITLKDVALQLGLLVDGATVTGSSD